MVNHCYDDILTRITEEPSWFDEHAVPRYCEFAPNKVANIYTNEAALVEVTCHHCRRLFRVAFSAAARGCVRRILVAPRLFILRGSRNRTKNCVLRDRLYPSNATSRRQVKDGRTCKWATDGFAMLDRFSFALTYWTASHGPAVPVLGASVDCRANLIIRNGNTQAIAFR
jgi:hypothetical protein